MVTYCIGSARQKRDYFKAAEGAVVLDNVEVLFCASENGRNYFAYGDVPFGDFTVEEYLKYRRALCKEKVTNATLDKYGISPRKRLKRLSAAELRIVMFLEKTAGRTDKAVVVNLDGTRYSARNNAALKRLLSGLSEAYVCVSDARFLKYADKNVRTLEFGKPQKAVRPAFYSAKRLAEKIGAKKIAVM